MRIHFSEERGDIMPSRSLQRMLRDCMEIMCRELGVQEEEYDLDVSFHTSLDKMRVNGQEGGKIRACVDPEISKDRRISIMVQRDHPHLLILALAHEFVHVRQMITGRLRVDGQSESAAVIFDGKRHSPGVIRMAHVLDMPSMLPWEEEAHKGMTALFLLVFDALPMETRLEIVQGMHASP